MRLYGCRRDRLLHMGRSNDRKEDSKASTLLPKLVRLTFLLRKVQSNLCIYRTIIHRPSSKQSTAKSSSLSNRSAGIHLDMVSFHPQFTSEDGGWTDDDLDAVEPLLRSKKEAEVSGPKATTLPQ